MCREMLLVAACLGLTGWSLLETGSTVQKSQLPAPRTLTPDEVASLPMGATVGLEQIENGVCYLTVGRIQEADLRTIVLSEVVRQNPPRHSVPLRYKVPYVSRLITSAGMRVQRLPTHCISLCDINAVVVLAPHPNRCVLRRISVEFPGAARY